MGIIIFDTMKMETTVRAEAPLYRPKSTRFYNPEQHDINPH